MRRKDTRGSEELCVFMHVEVDVFHPSPQSTKVIIAVPVTFHIVQDLVLDMLDIVNVGNQFISVLVALVPHRVDIQLYIS